MTRIESRPSRIHGKYDFLVDVEAPEAVLDASIANLAAQGADVKILGSTGAPKAGEVPWFPMRITDLDSFADKVLEAGEELSSDHPGFSDAVYRKRRADIVASAKTYRHGQAIPRIDYTEEELKTWNVVYSKLKELYPSHACAEHNRVFPLLEKFCGYGPNNIPQLEDISKFLQLATGWRVKPVMGLLSSRDFLNALAFRVFHSTQYIRHSSKPFYTPEPDVCHELLGHVPLFADPEFAEFSHAIGLASLGVSDEDIERLATCYWFTVEFGLCRQAGKMKAYGAGLLSSFGELDYCLTDKPEKKPFNPNITGSTKYPITEYQPVYFYTESFKDAAKQMLEFSMTLNRPFELRYNPYTLSVEILDSKEKLISYMHQISSELSEVARAIQKL
jgi:phenylalanine-4-hydroxylase